MRDFKTYTGLINSEVGYRLSTKPFTNDNAFYKNKSEYFAVIIFVLCRKMQ